MPDRVVEQTDYQKLEKQAQATETSCRIRELGEWITPEIAQAVGEMTMDEFDDYLTRVHRAVNAIRIGNRKRV